MKIRTKTLILSSVFIVFGSLESNAGPRVMFEKVDEWMKRWRAPRQAEIVDEKEVEQKGEGKRTSWCIYKDFKQKVDHTMRAHEFLKAYKAGRDFEKEIQDPLKRWPSQTIMLEISWREDKQGTNNSASSQKIGDERLTEETKVERSSSIFSEKESAVDSFPDLPKPQRSDSELIRIMPELLLELMDSLKQNPLKGSGKGKEKDKGSSEGDQREDVSEARNVSGNGKEKDTSKELTDIQKVVTKKKALSEPSIQYSSVDGRPGNAPRKPLRWSKNSIFFDLHEFDDEATSASSDKSYSRDSWIDPTWVVDENEQDFIKEQTEKEKAKKTK